MEFEAYSVGLVCASVCTSLSLEEATERLNKECPTGIRSQWQPAEDKTFSGGQPNPCDCKDHPGNKHYLFNC
ncbi:MAG: hypothetical protein JWM85_3613 [Acidimicrobiaceae bacterium]|nr:hypothetical protein [Acidimicrobiaceae bacterium]